MARGNLFTHLAKGLFASAALLHSGGRRASGVVARGGGRTTMRRAATGKKQKPKPWWETITRADVHAHAAREYKYEARMKLLYPPSAKGGWRRKSAKSAKMGVGRSGFTPMNLSTSVKTAKGHKQMMKLVSRMPSHYQNLGQLAYQHGGMGSLIQLSKRVGSLGGAGKKKRPTPKGKKRSVKTRVAQAKKQGRTGARTIQTQSKALRGKKASGSSGRGSGSIKVRSHSRSRGGKSFRVHSFSRAAPKRRR